MITKRNLLSMKREMKEGDFENLIELDTLELKSLSKSNRFTKDERKMLKEFILQKAIKEVIPLISFVVCFMVMKEVILKVNEEVNKNVKIKY